MDQISVKHEIYRKAFHFLQLIVPIAYCFLGRWISIAILGALTLTIVPLDYMRRKSPLVQGIFIKIFSLILRPHEKTGEKLCGASWALLGAFITFFFFKKEIAVTAFAILAISDAVAAIIGRSFPSRPFFEKSLYGAAAFFLSGLAILIFCGIIFHTKFGFYLFGLFALFCVTIIESRPSLMGLDDNFAIPVSFSIIMTFFDLVWSYI
jgi:dolichol kinase